MAVQAQYPSNVLFLSRNGQENNDYSLQPQPGGFLDPSHISLFNNGGISNPRKRGIEEMATPVNHFPMNQSHPSQLIELSQLHSQRNNGVSTGLRLSFGDQQKQQVSHSTSLLSLLSEDFSSLIKQQRDEIEQFLYTQAEELKYTLAEKKKKHYRALISVVEESVTRKLMEKEAEIEKATRRNAEYEARAAQLSMEAQLWRAKAKAQESTAAALQAQLHKVISGSVITGAQDKRVFGLECAEGVAEDAESGFIDPDRIIVPGPKCKGCRSKAATVVLLPCRHLCVCKDCEQVVRACPICLILRDSSVEVYLS